ncbi:MAG: TetR/AcrR family transcriptional regulator [Actinobacteria bacterium]|nr:TetR/AcrR family transcriptional regulator [Actinomycetota bacterium]
MLTKRQRTRQAILDAAAAVASEHGLDSLSIGSLAATTGMSKSGLFAHFGSKEELQLATVDHAAAIFVREVIDPGRSAPRGVARIWALLDGFLGYIEREVFAGGCFFATTSAEFKNRPGPVRDRIAEQLARWRAYLEHSVEQAQELGEITPTAEPRRVAFELNAFVQNAEAEHEIFGDPRAFADARAAVRERLESLRSEQRALAPSS